MNDLGTRAQGGRQGLSGTDELHAKDVQSAVAASSFWQDIIILERVESTNDFVKDLASQGAPAGTVAIADQQTAGRGRLGRNWLAPAGTSLLCSILFRPDLQPAQIHRLTMLCSMAAADAIEKLADLPVALKWPNDLVVKSQVLEPGAAEWRKLAGILTDTDLLDGRLAFSVVGIGINVNVPQNALADLAPNATSILAETGHQVDRGALLVALLQAAEARYKRLIDGVDPREEWSARLVTLGRRVRVTTTTAVLDGVAEAVDEDGALLLRTTDGSVRRLLAGDVTLARG